MSLANKLENYATQELIAIETNMRAKVGGDGMLLDTEHFNFVMALFMIIIHETFALMEVIFLERVVYCMKPIHVIHFFYGQTRLADVIENIHLKCHTLVQSRPKPLL